MLLISRFPRGISPETKEAPDSFEPGASRKDQISPKHTKRANDAFEMTIKRRANSLQKVSQPRNCSYKTNRRAEFLLRSSRTTVAFGRTTARIFVTNRALSTDSVVPARPSGAGLVGMVAPAAVAKFDCRVAAVEFEFQQFLSPHANIRWCIDRQAHSVPRNGHNSQPCPRSDHDLLSDGATQCQHADPP